MNKSNQNGISFILPAVAWVAALTIFPLAYLVYLSFTDYRAIRPGQGFIGLENYQQLFMDRSIVEALLRTLFFAISSTAITLLLGTITAWIFSYDLPGIRFLRSVFAAPLFTMSVAAATIGRFLLASNFGLFPEIPFLNDPALAGYALIAVDVWQWTPLVFVVVLNALRHIPGAEIDNARLDTKSDLTIFSVVAFPRVRRALLLVALLRLIESLQMFDLPYTLTNGGPLNSTTTLGLAVFKYTFQFFDIGYGSAVAVILLILVAIISFVFFRVMGQRFKTVVANPRTSLKSYLEALRSQ